MTSPNHPEGYPSNLQKTQTIKVKEGLVVFLRFTVFALDGGDYLSITDGDGTTLMARKSGYSLPAKITSRTNTVKLLFTTSEAHPRAGGWSVTWSAVTPITPYPGIFIYENSSTSYPYAGTWRKNINLPNH